MEPTDNPVSLLARAYAFAAARHAGQHRRVANEPYINHLTEVANLLSFATDGGDPALVAAGILHDSLEDTETTMSELQKLFGPRIAAIVAEVTDPPDIEETARRQRQVDHAPTLSTEARLLKIADKTSNIRERLAHRPADLSDAEICDYINWGAAVVAGCRGLNEKLEEAFDTSYEAAMRRYSGEAP